jgi:hypothetical protein
VDEKIMSKEDLNVDHILQAIERGGSHANRAIKTIARSNLDASGALHAVNRSKGVFASGVGKALGLDCAPIEIAPLSPFEAPTFAAEAIETGGRA